MKEIEEEIKRIEEKKREIEKQKDLVLEYKEYPEEYKHHKKELKKLQKEHIKMEKDEEGMYNTIDKYKEQIRMSEREIVQNDNLQSLKEKEIEGQKDKIGEMETILSAIQ